MVFLMLRAEIICAAVLLFLLIYYSIFKVKDKEFFFLKLSCVALSHVIFECCLILTMTFWGYIPEHTTRVLYIGFYITAFLFVVWFFSYVIRRLANYRHSRVIKNTGYLLLVFCTILLLALPMDHEHGRAVYYGHSVLDVIGYSVFLLYCILCTVLLFLRRDKLDNGIKLIIAPVVLILYAAVVLQAFWPERYMTGSCLTVICVALFAVLDNPDKDFVKQALWDFPTGLKNRNSYSKDIDRYTRPGAKELRIGLLVADMNHLKLTNDNYGHIEGDRLLRGAADMLLAQLVSAAEIYRLGGDEFVAIYLSVDDETVAAEMECVRAACAQAVGFKTPLSFAMGYAAGSTADDINDIFRLADRNMYEDKARIKKAAWTTEK